MVRKVMWSLITLALCLVIGLSNSYAQNAVTASVPFAFMVGGNEMPAGNYTIGSVSESVIAIRDRDTGKGVLSLVGHEWAGSDGTPKMVFHRYGNKYFLTQVCHGIGGAALQLPTSKQERELARELQIAKTGGKPAIETIVATK